MLSLRNTPLSTLFFRENSNTCPFASLAKGLVMSLSKFVTNRSDGV